VLRGSIMLDEVSARVSYPDRFRESSIPWTTSASIVMIHVHVTGFSLRHGLSAWVPGFHSCSPRPLFGHDGPGDRRVLAAEINGLDTCQTRRGPIRHSRPRAG
jgi:hypothetical protein